MKIKDVKELIPDLQQWLADIFSDDDLSKSNRDLIVDILEAYKDSLETTDKEPVPPKDGKEKLNELTAKITKLIGGIA